MLSKLQRGEWNDFWKKLKHSILRRNPCPLQWEELLGRAILQTYGKIISVQLQILLAPLTTEIKSWMHWGPSQDIMMLSMYVSWGKLWKDCKNIKAVGNDGIPSEVDKFASEWLITMMSIFLSSWLLTGKLLNSLMHVVIIPLLKCKSKDRADVNNYRPIAIATALSKVLEHILLSRLARYLWTADSQFGFK